MHVVQSLSLPLSATLTVRSRYAYRGFYYQHPRNGTRYTLLLSMLIAHCAQYCPNDQHLSKLNLAINFNSLQKSSYTFIHIIACLHFAYAFAII